MRLPFAPGQYDVRPSAGPGRMGKKMHDRMRDAEVPWRKFYKTARWQRLRRSIIVRDGQMCRATGILLIGRHPAPDSAVVDHIVPAHVFWWDGRRRLFWDPENLQTVSKAWHDSEKRKAEEEQRRRGGVG